MASSKLYLIKSANFDHHEPATADTYTEALAVAKARGWEANITCSGKLVAVWSPLYGTSIYNRKLAV